MDPVLLVTLTAAAVVLVVGLLVVIAVVAGRRRLVADLASSRADIDAMRVRLDDLSAVAARSTPDPRVGEPHVITSLPDVAATRCDGLDQVPDARRPTRSEFVSVALRESLRESLGESLVRVAALAHGVRRAASAQNRNRIRFEMRQEVKRARKQRRRDVKEAKRHLRAQQSPVRTPDEDAA